MSNHEESYLINNILLIYTIGLIVVVNAPGLIDPNTTISYFINNCVPSFVKGLMVAAMFAVMMSTIDSWLNTTAVLIGHDIFGRLYPKSRKQIMVGKQATVIVGAIAMLLAFNIHSIVGAIWTAYNFWEPMIMVPLCAGFMGFRTASESYFASLVGGILGISIGYLYAGELGTISIAFGVIISTIIFYFAHLYIKTYKLHLIPTEPMPNMTLRFSYA
jgi:Na+/proline symporter